MIALECECGAKVLFLTRELIQCPECKTIMRDITFYKSIDGTKSKSWEELANQADGCSVDKDSMCLMIKCDPQEADFCANAEKTEQFEEQLNRLKELIDERKKT